MNSCIVLSPPYNEFRFDEWFQEGDGGRLNDSRTGAVQRTISSLHLRTGLFSEQMMPRDAVARLIELGVRLDLEDLLTVETLHISDEEIPAEFGDTLAEMVPRLVTLNAARMASHDIRALLHLSSLQEIVAHHTAFADVILRNITAFRDVRTIAMSYTAVSDRDVALLADLPRLASIHLRGTALTDAAMLTFATLPELELLDLRNTEVTNEGVLQLRNLTSLFTIDVRDTAVTISGAARFRRLVEHSHPDVEVLV